MNPEPQIPTETTPPPRDPSTPFAYRGNGKVARLPKSIRDKICAWMLDGLSYPDIIQQLGPDGNDLNPGHLCEWRKRGFQDWLLEQAFLDRTRARQEPAAGLSADFDATQVGHAALQLGTLQIFEALRSIAPAERTEPGLAAPERSEGGLATPEQNAAALAAPEHNGAGLAAPERSEGGLAAPEHSEGGLATPPSAACPAPLSSSGGEGLGERRSPQNPLPAEVNSSPDDPNQKSKIKTQKFSALDLSLGGDSAAFVRLMNALARASRETMLLQKYREACARARAALQPMKDPKRKLSDDERRHLVLQVDEILGLPADDPEPEPSPTNLSRQSPAEADPPSAPLPLAPVAAATI